MRKIAGDVDTRRRPVYDDAIEEETEYKDQLSDGD